MDLTGSRSPQNFTREGDHGNSGQKVVQETSYSATIEPVAENTPEQLHKGRIVRELESIRNEPVTLASLITFCRNNGLQTFNDTHNVPASDSVAMNAESSRHRNRHSTRGGRSKHPAETPEGGRRNRHSTRGGRSKHSSETSESGPSFADNGKPDNRSERSVLSVTSREIPRRHYSSGKYARDELELPESSASSYMDMRSTSSDRFRRNKIILPDGYKSVSSEDLLQQRMRERSRSRRRHDAKTSLVDLIVTKQSIADMESLTTTTDDINDFTSVSDVSNVNTAVKLVRTSEKDTIYGTEGNSDSCTCTCTCKSNANSVDMDTIPLSSTVQTTKGYCEGREQLQQTIQEENSGQTSTIENSNNKGRTVSGPLTKANIEDKENRRILLTHGAQNSPLSIRDEKDKTDKVDKGAKQRSPDKRSVKHNPPVITKKGEVSRMQHGQVHDKSPHRQVKGASTKDSNIEPPTALVAQEKAEVNYSKVTINEDKKETEAMDKDNSTRKVDLHVLGAVSDTKNKLINPQSMSPKPNTHTHAPQQNGSCLKKQTEKIQPSEEPMLQGSSKGRSQSLTQREFVIYTTKDVQLSDSDATSENASTVVKGIGETKATETLEKNRSDGKRIPLIASLDRPIETEAARGNSAKRGKAIGNENNKHGPHAEYQIPRGQTPEMELTAVPVNIPVAVASDTVPGQHDTAELPDSDSRTGGSESSETGEVLTTRGVNGGMNGVNVSHQKMSLENGLGVDYSGSEEHIKPHDVQEAIPDKDKDKEIFSEDQSKNSIQAKESDNMSKGRDNKMADAQSPDDAGYHTEERSPKPSTSQTDYDGRTGRTSPVTSSLQSESFQVGASSSMSTPFNDVTPRRQKASSSQSTSRSNVSSRGKGVDRLRELQSRRVKASQDVKLYLLMEELRDSYREENVLQGHYLTEIKDTRKTIRSDLKRMRQVTPQPIPEKTDAVETDNVSKQDPEVQQEPEVHSEPNSKQPAPGAQKKLTTTAQVHNGSSSTSANNDSNAPTQKTVPTKLQNKTAVTSHPVTHIPRLTPRSKVPKASDKTDENAPEEEEEEEEVPKRRMKPRIDCRWGKDHPQYDQIMHGHKSTIKIPESRRMTEELRELKKRFSAGNLPSDNVYLIEALKLYPQGFPEEEIEEILKSLKSRRRKTESPNRQPSPPAFQDTLRSRTDRKTTQIPVRRHLKVKSQSFDGRRSRSSHQSDQSVVLIRRLENSKYGKLSESTRSQSFSSKGRKHADHRYIDMSATEAATHYRQFADSRLILPDIKKTRPGKVDNSKRNADANHSSSTQNSNGYTTLPSISFDSRQGNTNGKDNDKNGHAKLHVSDKDAIEIDDEFPSGGNDGSKKTYFSNGQASYFYEDGAYESEEISEHKPSPSKTSQINNNKNNKNNNNNNNKVNRSKDMPMNRAVEIVKARERFYDGNPKGPRGRSEYIGSHEREKGLQNIPATTKPSKIPRSQLRT